MWKEKNNKLHKSFVFENFNQAFAFIIQVAFLAVEKNHHPFWSNDFNKVEIYLSTHDSNNSITQKDIELARAIDLIFPHTLG